MLYVPYSSEKRLVHNTNYYIRKALHDVELRYSPMEKLAYVLIMSVRKLWPYFLEPPIEVLTNDPLR